MSFLTLPISMQLSTLFLFASSATVMGTKVPEADRPARGGIILVRATLQNKLKGGGNGHHLINRSNATAVYLEMGSRSPNDLTMCSDIDMMSPASDGRFLHKDGTPYPER